MKLCIVILGILFVPTLLTQAQGPTTTPTPTPTPLPVTWTSTVEVDGQTAALEFSISAGDAFQAAILLVCIGLLSFILYRQMQRQE